MIKPFRARVETVRTLTHDVRRLDLRLVEPNVISFLPGQHVTFEVTDPLTGRLVTRPYSIASSPSRSDGITLLLNLVKDGPGSTYLFSLTEGDETRFHGPSGEFHLREDQGRERLFVATGTGIAPIRSMLLAIAEHPDPRPATLFWGLRSQRDLYEPDLLGDPVLAAARLTTVITLSRPEPGWAGASGRVTRLVEERIASVGHTAAYLCGNRAMIEDTTALLRKKGLCPIYREQYYDDAGRAEE